MEVEGGQLRVYYNLGREDIDLDLDKAIEEAVAPFGWRRWASGTSLEDWTRDLAFRKESEDAVPKS